ncbi:MAG: sulfotransferase family protein [Candidatus Omnitrophica bacterium]|nr:sulfotransferase family protein [Candidatus Omnitrophota bacterium]
MLISKNRRFIFIHIYKNAGTSITKALMPFTMNKLQRSRLGQQLKRLHIPYFEPRSYPTHINASELITEIGKNVFNSFFSFAIVRNPWDWQVSLYHYTLKDTSHFQHQLFKNFRNFDEYIRWRCAEEVRFQKDFIYSKDGTLLVNFVGRFEKIDTDFKTICSHIGVSASLPKLNVSNTKPYQQFYNEETKNLVRQTFAADIALFGYDF